MKKGRLVTFLRVLVSIVLVALLVRHVGLSGIAHHAAHVDLKLTSLAFALLVGETLVRCANWRQLNEAAGCAMPFRDVAYSYFVGGFFGSFLPSTLSTDAARSAIASARSGARVEALLATTVSLNLVSLVVVSTLALLACGIVSWPSGPAPGVVGPSLVASLACLGAVAALAVLLQWQRRGLGSRGGRETSGFMSAAYRVSRRFTMALLVLRGEASTGARVICTAALSYALRVAGWWALIGAAGASAPWTGLLVVGPLATVGAALPVSVLGFGGQQAISVYLLADWGVGAAQAVLASLLQAALYTSLYIFGAIAYASSRSSRAPRTMADERVSLGS
jgi:hypothetical protein